MARVVFVGEGLHREVRLGDLTRLGRDPAAEVHMADRGVSWEHAIIERRGKRYLARDAGSRNGTYVNRRRLDGERWLADGDEILIGLNRLVFREDAREDLVGRVTIEARSNDAIHQRLRDNVEHERFRPASEIRDRKQLERDYEKLRVANELNHAVMGEVDTSRVLDRILATALAMFGADRGVILLTNAETGELEPLAFRSRHPGEVGFAVSHTILKEVVAERASILSTDARTDQRFGRSQSIVLAGIKATMAVPMLDGVDVLGVIYLDSQLTAGAFADKDLGLLNGFGRQAAQALVHQRLVEQKERDLIARGQLARLLAPALVDQVMSGELELVRGGTLCDATVLFSDIRGFTPLSERYPATEIVRLLNDYFDVMVDVVFRHGGTLDKFIGDAVMAIWGAPIGDEEHCLRAVRAALEMQAAIADFNATRAVRGHPEIAVGIGVSTGELVAGYMGSARAMGYTVIGDVVNVGSRLCSIAAAGDVLVTEEVRAQVPDTVALEALEPRALKGKSAPVVVYRVLGFGEAPAIALTDDEG